MTAADSDPEPEVATPTRKPRATVAGVDAKIDQVLEEVDGIRIEMSQLRNVLRDLAEALKPEPTKAPEPGSDFGMYG